MASGDTLSGFLRDLKARYPEMQGVLPEAQGAPASAAPANGAPAGGAAQPAKPDAEPTGSVDAVGFARRLTSR